jgi:hypothetical protein
MKKSLLISIAVIAVVYLLQKRLIVAKKPLTLTDRKSTRDLTKTDQVFNFSPGEIVGFNIGKYTDGNGNQGYIVKRNRKQEFLLATSSNKINYKKGII